MTVDVRLTKVEKEIQRLNTLVLGARRAAGGAAAHNILSITHSDSNPAALIRGDILAVDASPDLARLAIGVAGTYVRSDGVDPSWAAIVAGDLPAHAALHELGGGDQVDHDNLLNYVANEHIDWTNAVDNFKTTGTIEGLTAKFSDLTDGYVPYHVSDALGLANSPIFTDGTNVGIGTTTPGTIASGTPAGTFLNVVSSASVGRLVAQGAIGGELALVDTGGAIDDKWLALNVDGGVGKFYSVNDTGTGLVAANILVMDLGTGNVGIGKVPASSLDINLPTEDLEIVDAGSAGATEQDWIEVEIGGIQGYLHVFAAK